MCLLTFDIVPLNESDKYRIIIYPLSLMTKLVLLFFPCWFLMALHSQFADVKDSWNLSYFMNGKAKLWPQFKLQDYWQQQEKWEHNLKKNVLNLKQNG